MSLYKITVRVAEAEDGPQDKRTEVFYAVADHAMGAGLALQLSDMLLKGPIDRIEWVSDNVVVQS